MSERIVVDSRNINHGIGIVQVARALAKKGRTLKALIEKPRVRFISEELRKMQTIGGITFNAGILTNDFANQAVQLALGGDKIAKILFRAQQLKINGLPSTIHGNKPAIIDLEPLEMYYQNSENQVIEAEVIKYDEHTWISPEQLKSGIDKMPLAFKWGVIRDKDDELYCSHGNFTFIPNKELNKWLISSPGFFSTTPLTKPDEAEKSVEIDGLVFKSQDSGKKLEISANVPFSGIKEITLPLLTSYKWAELVPIKVEYKKR